MIRSIHPEHGYESEALEETVAEIEKSVSDISTSPTGGVDSHGDEAVSEVLGEMLAAQQESLELGPYFARVDYREDGEEPGTIYIGRHGFDGKNRRIVSWASDRGRLIYRDSSEEQVIDTPGGKEKLRLLLQRNFKIENLELRDLFDKVDRRDGSTVTLAGNAQQAYLLRQLYSRGDRRLRDIVETIQQEQDGLIRAPADAPLIINGVAGSGKTSIGYHRLAYLLSPENELNLGLDVSRALVLGPNAYFMSYASSVLPGLSLQGIRHTTYDEWAMRSMDFVVDGKDGRRLYRLHDGTLGKLLSPQSRPQEIDAYVRRSQLKGQLKFASAIERLAEAARELGSSPTILLTGLKRAKPVSLSPADWDAHYARALSSRTSVSGQQEELIRRLVQVALRRAEVSSQDREEVAADWRVRIENSVHQVWPRFDFREAYYDLLKDRSKLKRFGDLLTDQEMQLLATSPRTPERNVDIEDLPGLHYLHLLTEREGQPRIYDHIVVDEGQDLSPLRYLVLRRHVKNGGLTVLGDLAQGVHRYRGISDWAQVAEALGTGSESVRNISQSYRSTKEIVAFANALLEKVNPDAAAARPIDRSGERPRIVKSASSGEMLESVARDARKLLDSEYSNVAVIVKGTRVRRAVARALADHIVPHEVLSLESLSSLSSLNEGVSVVPVELAKGVEYEAVLVVDVTKTQYGKRSWLDGQLLYVAATRALHHLDLYFHGEPSPYLDHLVGEYGVKASSD